MELTVHLNSLSFVSDFMDMGVNVFVAGANCFSCRSELLLDYQQLTQLKTQLAHKARLFVLVNALVEQKYLDDLKSHLQKLENIGIDGLLFQDFAVLTICKENRYSFELIYAPDTLNTNHMTLQYLNNKGIDGAFLAREIPLKEKQEIASKLTCKTMMQIHGVEYMGYSKRYLLKNYFDVTNQTIAPTSKNIKIIADKQEDEVHIYEDQYGTHMLSSKQIACIDVMAHLEAFDYLLIDSLMIPPFILVEVVYLYAQAMDYLKNGSYLKEVNNLKELLIKLTPNTTYYHGFLFDSTVYKIADVRKREEHVGN